MSSNAQWSFNPTRHRGVSFSSIAVFIASNWEQYFFNWTSVFTKCAQYTMVSPSHQIHSVSFLSIAVFIVSSWEQYLSELNVWFYKKELSTQCFFHRTRYTCIILSNCCLWNSSSLRNIPISGRIESWIFLKNDQR